MAKFKDISQLTRGANYRIHVPWKHIPSWIKEAEGDLGLDMNPDFQRGHVWTVAQQQAYVEYILKGGVSGKEIYFNHPGWMGNFKGNFYCVDGLQRITAVLHFLENRVAIFGGLFFKDFEDRLPGHANFNLTVNNLKSKKEVLSWYLEMNIGGTIHSSDELDRVQKMLDEEKK
jgi:hypothetical protein